MIRRSAFRSATLVIAVAVALAAPAVAFGAGVAGHISMWNTWADWGAFNRAPDGTTENASLLVQDFRYGPLGLFGGDTLRAGAYWSQCVPISDGVRHGALVKSFSVEIPVSDVVYVDKLIRSARIAYTGPVTVFTSECWDYEPPILLSQETRQITLDAAWTPYGDSEITKTAGVDSGVVDMIEQRSATLFGVFRDDLGNGYAGLGAGAVASDLGGNARLWDEKTVITYPPR